MSADSPFQLVKLFHVEPVSMPVLFFPFDASGIKPRPAAGCKDAAAMQARGKISQWDDERGFGFITPLGGGEKVFFHISACPGGRRPVLGQIVSFERGQDARGRPSAAKVSRNGSNRAAARAFAIVIAFLGAVGYGAARRFYPSWVFWLYLGMSVLAYLMYYLDKRAARNDAQRTPENTLHLVALLGGWPGALFAQQQLRHKSVKASFRSAFWTTVIVNLAVVLASVLKQLHVW